MEARNSINLLSLCSFYLIKKPIDFAFKQTDPTTTTTIETERERAKKVVSEKYRIPFFSRVMSFAQRIPREFLYFS